MQAKIFNVRTSCHVQTSCQLSRPPAISTLLKVVALAKERTAWTQLFGTAVGSAMKQTIPLDVSKHRPSSSGDLSKPRNLSKKSREFALALDKPTEL